MNTLNTLKFLAVLYVLLSIIVFVMPSTLFGDLSINKKEANIKNSFFILIFAIIAVETFVASPNSAYSSSFHKIILGLSALFIYKLKSNQLSEYTIGLYTISSTVISHMRFLHLIAAIIFGLLATFLLPKLRFFQKSWNIQSKRYNEHNVSEEEYCTQINNFILLLLPIIFL